MQSNQDVLDRPTGETLVQCLRVGAPPYRFYGVPFARVESVVAQDITLFAQLWERRKGGFVVGFSRLNEGVWRPDIYIVPTIDEAIEKMEQICAAQTPASFPSDLYQSQNDIELLSAVARERNELQLFSTLIGRALDAWSCAAARQRVAS